MEKVVKEATAEKKEKKSAALKVRKNLVWD